MKWAAREVHCKIRSLPIFVVTGILLDNSQMYQIRVSSRQASGHIVVANINIVLDKHKDQRNGKQTEADSIAVYVQVVMG